MASWIHKTTLQFQRSEDPPLEEQNDWVKNPVLPEGCADWSEVVIENGVVRAPTSGELAVRTAAKLAATKSSKMAEIDRRSSVLLESGLVVATGKTISTSQAAQSNLQDMMIGVGPGLTQFPQDVSTIDGGAYTITNSADLSRIAGLWRDRKKAVLDAGRALRAQVLAASTIAAVDSVSDARS